MSTKKFTFEQALQIALRHHQAGHLRQAEVIYQKLLQQQPRHSDTLYLLGSLCHQKRQHQEAEKLIKQAIAIAPANAHYHYNLGLVLAAQDQIETATAAFQRAIALNPRYAEAYNNLATIQQEVGLYDAAHHNYQQALNIRPDYQQARSNLLSLLSYNVLCTPEEMLLAHREWDRIHGGPDKARTFSHPVRDDPGRRLRIGYVSTDLRRHVISNFFEPILEHHDAAQVEVFCYAEVDNPDDVTRRLQGLAHRWRFTVGMSDRELADQIHEDHIDILVDLNGHTTAVSNRLGAFTYKPAPVQATYLGYFTTTGLTAMDYWITDEVLHPQDTIELANETLWRLPRCCMVYSPPPEAPLPSERQAHDIIFACFNHLSKISPAAVELWSQVLRAVPTAQLMIKTKQLADSAIQTMMKKRFAAQGIPPERLILLPHNVSYEEHLATYGKIDIVLDAVPRTGGTMTAEALWMGVPVITLAGERFIERLSASMLEAIGVPQLIAYDQADYIEKAAALARNHSQRQQLRATLRQRMAQSPLCDGPSLARTLEKAYRDMWHRYLKYAEDQTVETP